ncbi:polar amino acid ABC transporter, inner membrane subunit [Oleidesulfovibrio alaskensis G20]|jgi:polar amino acid transport system permease protein|uniref:Polar amino acid ABC transporter, inner membrane subunit n=1 Tax=Oleidesulfovibrio alaskensis (strain ATCC BAA-1058 / DSM 17464 / G20) TaxID=207559 RepID=Q317B0_OLEA2|nr:amino acid ABC transporter permease [Oleidesulfovibrio alaskensis]ABB36986.1 polar amino acid ABC transporter, inner membrane subunit [Oleidesulfovibrio alaskensis G20]MBG0774506.1 amino acid ABC transporter permease [Oleidesulfovibrio alaskensis]MBL3582808.1 amino acid ABC transporter permease [Oleidesulfovibrio alaskensis]
MMQQLTTVLEAMPYILQGGLVSLLIVAGAMMLGLAMGIPMAVGQVYGSPFLRRLIGLYVWFFRGVPILVLMFLFYFGVFELLGLNLSAISATALVLGMTSAAYQSQIFRGSIQALPAGQLKAARAMGMSDSQAIRAVILPQALRLSLPGWSNEYSIILKDSALAYVVGAMDIFTRTHFVASRTYEHLPLFIAAGALYFVITLTGVKLLAALEKKVRIPGYTT